MNGRTIYADVAPETPGRKDDDGKRDYTLIPFAGLDVIAQVLEHGAKRYGAENWRAVDDAPARYLKAMARHVFARLRGEINDPDSGLPHLAHAACCILFMLEKGAP